MINFAANLNKMIDAGLGGPLDPPRTEVAVGHRVVYTEASGDVVNFDTNVVAPVKNLRVTMEPIQAGSGDPSPDNIRPITGRDAVTVYRSGADMSDPQSVTVQLGQTVYGGTVDVTTGVMTVTDTMVDLGSLTWGFRDVYGGFFHSGGLTDSAADSSVCICSSYRNAWGGSAFIQNNDCVVFVNANGNGGAITGGASYKHIILTDRRFTDAASLKAALSGVMLCYKLATPQTIQLTPEQLTTLKGQNNVWSDADSVSVEYPYYEETEGY